jgi:predicted MPP superfamily phosphohydrolase
MELDAETPNPSPSMSRRTFMRHATHGVLAGGLLMAGDGYLLERTNYEVTRYDVPAPHLAKPFSVAFMSDLHRSPTTSVDDLRAAARLCMNQQPDAVLLGGDYITSHAHLATECAEALAELRPPHGVYFVLGNHDHWSGPTIVARAFTRAGFTDITNANTELAPGLRLCGLDDVWAGMPNIPLAFRGAEGPSQTRLLLTHNPKIFPRVRERQCVMICGHTHGGQINLPLIPNPYMRAVTRYVKGWFHEEGSSLYVNRGIGTLTIPVRLNCRPEITVLRFIPQA